MQADIEADMGADMGVVRGNLLRALANEWSSYNDLNLAEITFPLIISYKHYSGVQITTTCDLVFNGIRESLNDVAADQFFILDLGHLVLTLGGKESESLALEALEAWRPLPAPPGEPPPRA